MGLRNFILTCEKDNKELRKDLEYYKNRISRLEKENQELKEQLSVTQTNEETFRLEMEDITKILGLDEDTIFDDVKAYAKSLKDNMFEKEQLKKQLEEKNKPQIFIDTQNIEERYAEGLYQDYLEEENKKHKNQQKEFIKFLEDNYKETHDIWYIKILQKYKSIIGDIDENN